MYELRRVLNNIKSLNYTDKIISNIYLYYSRLHNCKTYKV